ncbi:hypothetical protein [Photobacterium profundum]|nr:hypothetical protein [Photobacterium profundum]
MLDVITVILPLSLWFVLRQVVAFLISCQLKCSEFRLSVIAVQGLEEARLSCQVSIVNNKFFSRNFSLMLFVIAPLRFKFCGSKFIAKCAG